MRGGGWTLLVMEVQQGKNLSGQCPLCIPEPLEWLQRKVRLRSLCVGAFLSVYVVAVAHSPWQLSTCLTTFGVSDTPSMLWGACFTQKLQTVLLRNGLGK